MSTNETLLDPVCDMVVGLPTVVVMLDAERNAAKIAPAGICEQAEEPH